MAPILSRLTALGGGGSGGFGFGRRRGSLREFIQYYIFTSPGSLNTNAANNFGFTFSPSALVNLLTIGDGSSGTSGNSSPANNGGASGTVVVRTDVPLGTVAPGGSLPYTLGTITSGVSIGSTSGGVGATNAFTSGATGNPGSFPSLTPYAPKFELYTITAGSGGSGGGTSNYSGPWGGGGGGGAGGLVITKTLSDTPRIYGPSDVIEITANSGTPGGITGTGPGAPNNNIRGGGGGGTGGTGYGAGGGGGGGPVENWGAHSPGGSGGAGAGGIFIIKISEFLYGF